MKFLSGQCENGNALVSTKGIWKASILPSIAAKN